MNTRRPIGIGVVLVGLLVLALVPGWRAMAQSQLIMWPSEMMKWTAVAGVPGAQQAVLWGDPAKGAYGALKQVPPGSVLPAHTHKNDSRVITIKGTIAVDIGGKTTAMGPGSYAMLPAGMPHAATCRSSSPCEYFEEMSGPFDSMLVK
jgi:quercetin dioxygenase-like cupin family protein